MNYPLTNILMYTAQYLNGIELFWRRDNLPIYTLTWAMWDVLLLHVLHVPSEGSRPLKHHPPLQLLQLLQYKLRKLQTKISRQSDNRIITFTLNLDLIRKQNILKIYLNISIICNKAGIIHVRIITLLI